MMRSALVLAGCAVRLLLWAGLALGLSLETACENAKLQAAGAYARCLARAARDANATSDDLSAEAIEQCDERFDRMFERAEATGACRTAGGPSSLRGPIRGQMAETLEATTAGPGCPTTAVRDGETYICTLTKNSAVDLAQIVAQIDEPDVTLESIVWIEAWGGTGSHGNTSNGGGGGGGGREGTGASDCVSGGGGGGASLAQAATVSCSRSRPGNSPNGTAGAVQIVFQAGRCG
jgi:hypothetical protein